MPRSRPVPRATDETSVRLREAAGPLTAEAVGRMSDRFAWFRDLPPEQRSWIGLVAQSGVTAFLHWLSDPKGEGGSGVPGLAALVFGTAPPEMARAVSLAQTVDLVRVTVAVVEEHAPELAPPSGRAALREAVLVFSRDVAFAAAEVYAKAAEQRGAWDARLEALLVDHVTRDEPAEIVLSQAAALGWEAPGGVTVVVGAPPAGDVVRVLALVHASAERAKIPVLAGVQGAQLVVVAGLSAPDDDAAGRGARALATVFGDGPIVYGEPVPGLAAAGGCARAALSAARVSQSFPALERPAPAGALLPERALAGDAEARHQLVQDVYNALAAQHSDLLDTVSQYVESGGSLEATGRALFVHANTVRYRLRRAGEITGLKLSSPRGRFVAQIALVLGRLSPDPPGRRSL